MCRNQNLYSGKLEPHFGCDLDSNNDRAAAIRRIIRDDDGEPLICVPRQLLAFPSTGALFRLHSQ